MLGRDAPWLVEGDGMDRLCFRRVVVVAVCSLVRSGLRGTGEREEAKLTCMTAVITGCLLGGGEQARGGVKKRVPGDPRIGQTSGNRM